MLRLREDLFRTAVQRAAGGQALTFGTTDPGFRDWLFEFFDDQGWVYVRMWWERNWMSSEPTAAANELPTFDERA